MRSIRAFHFSEPRCQLGAGFWVWRKGLVSSLPTEGLSITLQVLEWMEMG